MNQFKSIRQADFSTDTNKTRFWTIEIICFLYILLFVYASAIKLVDVQQFITQLLQSPVLMAFAKWLAILVPVTELVIVGALLFPRFRLLGLYGALAMMTMFYPFLCMCSHGRV